MFRFPAGFLWGAATASHQVEGDNRWNDWWEFENDGRVPFRSADACRHYELYESDFELARSWGHNAHRLSIEWSRIEPEEGHFNHAALEHYVRVVAGLRQRDLEPIVTLHHFTNPAWFTRRGGWTRFDSVELYCRYVEFVASRLSGNVRFWLTINEPTVYVKRAYVTGTWPPCATKSWRQAALALRHLCRAHTAAYPLLHRYRPDAMVGFAHSAPYVEAFDPKRLADRLVAHVRDFVLNGLCFRLLGARAHRVLDFIGINYYTRQLVRWRPVGLAFLLGTECVENNDSEPRSFNSLGWEIFPQGLRRILARFSRFGVPLMVTENGVSTSDESLRTDFVIRHIEALAEALRDGIEVTGYLYWTLFDNFEWTEGFGARFGLFAVDSSNQHRLTRPAALVFESICRSNEIALTDHSER